MGIIAPLIKDASSEHKKAIVLPISFGYPILPIAVVAVINPLACGMAENSGALKSSSSPPGATAFTVILLLPKKLAK